MPTIGVEGQYFLTIDGVDFSEHDFKSIRLFEFAGIKLPQAILIFYTTDGEARSKLHAGTILTIALAASDQDGTRPTAFKVVDTTTEPRGDGEYIVKVTMEQYLEAYTSTAISASYEGTSIAAITKLCSPFTTIDNKATGALDNQVWLRPLISARDMLLHIWLHARLNNTTLLLAHTLDGELRIRDTRSIARRGTNYDFRTLSEIVDSRKDIGLLGKSVEKSSSGVLSHLAAAGRKMHTYSLSSGTSGILQAAKVLKFLSTRPTLEVGTQNIAMLKTVVSDNVHATFDQALLDNKANLARLGTVELPIYTKGKYIPIHPLDLVMHLEPHSQQTESVDAGSGLYIVGATVREVTASTLDTTIILTRESRNGD